MQAILSGFVQSGSDKKNIILSDILPKRTDPYNNIWVRITNKDSSVYIRKITTYTEGEKKIILNKDIDVVPDTTSKYDIGEFKELEKAMSNSLTINKDSNKRHIELSADNKKPDKIYNKYWILIISGKAKDDVRRVKEYINNFLVLDYELSDDIAEGDKFLLLPHYFNDYVMFGVLDFTNFLGMDFSSLIDNLGGLIGFQLTTVGICICCLICISMLFMMIKKKSGRGGGGGGGLVIPGIGQLGRQQPLVIQMPMQTQPYPFKDSPFPRDT
jgi:hypothetical protein